MISLKTLQGGASSKPPALMVYVNLDLPGALRVADGEMQRGERPATRNRRGMVFFQSM